jgi:hypothetical protein
VIGLNNASLYLEQIAEWQTDHGEDPEKTVSETVALADQAIRINKQNPLAYGTSGLAMATDAAYRLDAGRDGREQARQAIDHFRSQLAIDQNLTYAIRDLSRAYYLLASHERMLNLDPRPDLDQGLRTLERCYRLESDNPDCKVMDAQLRIEYAEWARQKGLPFWPLLEQAQRLAREAAEKLPSRGDVWLVLGKARLARIEALLASHRPAASLAPELEDGIRGIERSLRLAPGLPRALAVQGALLLSQAQTLTDAAQKKATLERARVSLSRAFAGNALLKRRYGGLMEEAGRLAK